MSKWIAEFDLEDGDTMPEHMDLEYMGAKIDFHCRPMWIPVSERLPDECMNCLITVKIDAYFCNPHYENYIAWFDGKDFVYEYKNKSIVAKISIIAWQPLPEPYKVESEG